MVTLDELNKELNKPELNPDEEEVLQKIEDEIEAIIKRDFKNNDTMYYKCTSMEKILRMVSDKRHKYIINHLSFVMLKAGWEFILYDDSTNDSYYRISPIKK